MPDQWGRPTMQTGLRLAAGIAGAERYISGLEKEREEEQRGKDVSTAGLALTKGEDISGRYAPEVEQQATDDHMDRQLKQFMLKNEELRHDENTIRSKTATLEFEWKNVLASKNRIDHLIAGGNTKGAVEEGIKVANSNVHTGNHYEIDHENGQVVVTDISTGEQTLVGFDEAVIELQNTLGQISGLSLDDWTQRGLVGEARVTEINMRHMEKRQRVIDPKTGEMAWRIPGGVDPYTHAQTGPYYVKDLDSPAIPDGAGRFTPYDQWKAERDDKQAQAAAPGEKADDLRKRTYEEIKNLTTAMKSVLMPFMEKGQDMNSLFADEEKGQLSSVADTALEKARQASMDPTHPWHAQAQQALMLNENLTGLAAGLDLRDIKPWSAFDKPTTGQPAVAPGTPPPAGQGLDPLAKLTPPGGVDIAEPAPASGGLAVAPEPTTEDISAFFQSPAAQESGFMANVDQSLTPEYREEKQRTRTERTRQSFVRPGPGGLTKNQQGQRDKTAPGWLGTLKRPDGKVSTEVSIGVQLNGKETEIPLLVPGLTQAEIDYVLRMNKDSKVPPEIAEKAIKHAQKQIQAGKSPFKE